MDDAHPKMRFSLSPPPPKSSASAAASPTNSMNTRGSANHHDPQLRGGIKSDEETSSTTAADDAASDYHQWLHAMKLVARLPGGMPPEFRRKLWLSLADKYLKTKNVDWSKEEEKCFCEKWREDDEELGIQIVKDLHRTGSNLCTGPAGSINQAKLQRILLGYARYNPEVGYCQGFNMLGALILQVMDKEEAESMKVMIYLVEGVLPSGYFCGSMGGLQADMGVFRDLMQTKLPRLAKHLQKLQGPIENAYEPPLTNVFTMQWFLTMFCTCLPMTCVLRVWDLVLIEGSDVLLRTALVLWSLLEERVLSARTADDFYCKMGSFSSELLNGHLIDSNGLIEKVVQLGPIPDIQKLRDKHLYNIAPLRHKQGLQLYYDDEEPESDEESRLAVATVWGIPWGRRGSHDTKTSAFKQTPENKDRIALDISLLKKQYDRLRERQKQAHIILTTACSTARQGATPGTSNPNQNVPVNQLLLGRSAIITNRGRRIGPPPGAIPPARKPSLPAILQTKAPEKQLRRGETLHWRDTDLSKRRRDSLTWKEIKADRAATLSVDISDSSTPAHKLRTRRMGKSDSSSYSEESDDDEEASSTDTSLCDEDDPTSTGDKMHSSSIEKSPKRRSKSGRKQKDMPKKLQNLKTTLGTTKERKRPKSWAPTTNEIPFMLMTSESPVHSEDERSAPSVHHENLSKEEEDSATESDRFGFRRIKDLNWSDTKYSPIAGDLATTKLTPLHVHTDILELPVITSTSQLSPMPDISTYINNSTISPLPTPKPLFLDSTNSLGSCDGDDVKKFDVSDDGVTNEYFERVNSVERPTKLDLFFSLNEENIVLTSYDDSQHNPSDEHKSDTTVPNYKSEFIFKPDINETDDECDQPKIIIVVNDKDTNLNRRMELFMDYSEKSSTAFIAEATSELTTTLRKEKLKDEEDQKLTITVVNAVRDDHIPGESRDDFTEGVNITDIKPLPKTMKISRAHSFNNANKKRRDPRRLTLTRSSTIDIEDRFQALDNRLSKENFNEESPHIKKKGNHDQNDATSPQSTKMIPSTADLEQRYNSLERQLSISNIKKRESPVNITDKDFIIKCVDKSELKSKVSISESEIDPLTKPNRDHIPSTADLESRFNALEKQMSSNTLTTKNSIDLKCDSKDDKDTSETSKKVTKENAGEETKSQNVQTDTGSKSIKVHEEKTSEPEKLRLVKLPSTAELEDRFNALERKMSVQKSSPSKTKKEPPDVTEKESSKHEEKMHHDNGNKQKKIDQNDKEEKSEKNGEKIKSHDYRKDVNRKDIKVENQENSSNSQTPKLNMQTQMHTSVENGKKSPPSTEELEKRFQALEKQLSTSSFDSEIEASNKNKTSLVKPHQEEDLYEKLKHNNKKVPEDKSNTELKSSVKEITKLKSVDEEKPNINTKLFEEKCEEVNENILIECSKKECLQQEQQRVAEQKSKPQQQIKSVEIFNEKCKSVNEQILQANKLDTIERNETLAKELEKRKEQREIAKRRASEPPSTEDLEKRYESLQRRMSSKTIIEKIITKSETVDEALQRIEKEVIVEALEVENTNDDNNGVEAHASTQSVSPECVKVVKIKKIAEPPSTEDLESRFEALQKNQNNEGINTININNKIEEKTVISPGNSKIVDGKVSSNPPSTEDLESRFEALQQKSIKNSSEKIETNKNTCAQSEDYKPSTPHEPTQRQDCQHDINESIPNIITSKSVEQSKIVSVSRIPDAPPMPKREQTEKFTNSIIMSDEVKQNQRRALIEEFQSKIKTQPNDENLKPSDINPNRKTPPAQRAARHTVDDTSETHADPAFYRSEYYEPWQIQQKRMVRRFSDLPSRADLENRLQFLEKQLTKKFYKQRCASDSEVASRRHFVLLAPNVDNDDEMPSTSKSQRSTDDLENRVQVLEKQLSENSLKLLEAMRTKTHEADFESPRGLSTDTIDATGKELVRYTHFGELDEIESHQPINISINIKMMLNKDGSDKKKEKEELPTTEELEKRLEVLEQQLKASRARGVVNAEKEELKTEQETKLILENKTLKTELPPAVEKLEKDIVNSEVNTDFKDTQLQLEHQPKTEEIISTELDSKPEDKSNVEQKVLDTKEAKTIENQEIARSRKSEEIENKSETEEIKGNEVNNFKLQQEVNKPNFNDKKDKEDVLESDAHMKPDEITDATASNKQADNADINSANVGPVDPNNKTLVLLLDNEPKAVKVRRLTRANTEELEDLFQALEKQISQRNLIKSDNGKLIRADSIQKSEKDKTLEESKAISDLTKEIEEFTSSDKEAETAAKPKEADVYDWGPDPVKRHLKRKTVHLPSTKELESRFRSLERQIKLLEGVENIDVEQRLSEIERKIKLQYSLSQERDLTKFLELCEGKGLDDYADIAAKTVQIGQAETPRQSPARSIIKSPHTSPSRVKDKTPYTSPTRTQDQRSPYTSPSRSSKRSPSRKNQADDISSLESLEYRYRILELPRSKSKDSLDERSKKIAELKKHAVHPIEMLLDPSPDDSGIPITGELEHRMRVLDKRNTTPSPPRKARSRSPTIDDIKRQKMLENQRPRTPIHNLERLVASPTRRELPTEDELEARMRALEQEKCFDFKMQRNFNEFNQKLKDVVSPSLSFDEFRSSKSRERSPRRSDAHRTTAPKSVLRDTDTETRREEYHLRSTSPKVIRFREDEEYSRAKSRAEQRDNERMVGNADGVLQIIEENSKMLHRILKKTLADSNISIISGVTGVAEGLDAMGSRLMRETSPITRTGTHTGCRLRTDDNINDRLNSIKNTIKSIDTLCEEKPYRKEKCQRYIDSLFSDSVYFANQHKKSSLEDLSRSVSRNRYEYTPSIRVSDQSQRPSEYYLSRSMGSAESIRSTSPLRPLHYRSNRDLRRDTSPRQRRDEEREEYESRVRRENMLPNHFLDNHSDLSSSSLTKFHKVDRQLDTYKYDEREKSSSRSASKSPLRSPYGSRDTMFNTTNTTTSNTSTISTKENSNRMDLDRPVSPYRQTSHNLLRYDSSVKRSNTPVYAPAKLEIRHTTVTSTFYDRLLTEKQIEKNNLSRPPSRSPVVSPSVTSKSYLDIPIASATTKTSNENSPTTTAQMRGIVGTTGLSIGSNYSYTPNYAGSTHSATTFETLPTYTTSFNSSNTQYSATTPTGNSSKYQTALLSRLPPLVTDASHTDLRIRSCDNILMQLKSTPTTNAAGAGFMAVTSTTTTSTPSALITSTATPSVINNITSLYNPTATTIYSYLNPSSNTSIVSANTTNTTATTTLFNLHQTTSPYSTGIYNPLMPLTTRQPSDIGITLGLYTSTLNNNTANSSFGISATELPKN